MKGRKKEGLHFQKQIVYSDWEKEGKSKILSTEIKIKLRGRRKTYTHTAKTNKKTDKESDGEGEKHQPENSKKNTNLKKHEKKILQKETVR